MKYNKKHIYLFFIKKKTKNKTHFVIIKVLLEDVMHAALLMGSVVKK